jgi:hypothetical protein
VRAEIDLPRSLKAAMLRGLVRVVRDADGLRVGHRDHEGLPIRVSPDGRWDDGETKGKGYYSLCRRLGLDFELALSTATLKGTATPTAHPRHND